MGKVRNLKIYLEEKDKNGHKVADWAIQAGDGLFKCKFCLPCKVLKFDQGKKELFKH